MSRSFSARVWSDCLTGWRSHQAKRKKLQLLVEHSLQISHRDFIVRQDLQALEGVLDGTYIFLPQVQ